MHHSARGDGPEAIRWVTFFDTVSKCDTFVFVVATHAIILRVLVMLVQLSDHTYSTSQPADSWPDNCKCVRHQTAKCMCHHFAANGLETSKLPNTTSPVSHHNCATDLRHEAHEVCKTWTANQTPDMRHWSKCTKRYSNDMALHDRSNPPIQTGGPQ